MTTNYEHRPIVITTAPGSTAALHEMFGVTADGKIVVSHTATDDGAGGFLSDLGAVNYAGKSFSLRVIRLDRTVSGYKADHERAADFGAALADGGSSVGAQQLGGEYARVPVSEGLFAGASVIARYRVAPAVPVARTQTFTPPTVSINLCPYTSDTIVPGSIQFVWMGETYTDFEGRMYRGRTDVLPGVDSGSVDYLSGVALLSDYVVGASPGTITLQSLWTRRAPWRAASIFMRTQAAPIKPTGYVLTLTDTQGSQLTATGDLNGNLGGTHMWGKIDYLTGVVELQFGDFVLDSSLTAAQKAEWWYNAADVGAVEALKIWRPWPVDPTTLRYNSVAYFYLPIDADILGLDPVRLPQDGRVPIFRVGSYVVVGHTGALPPATVSNGQTLNCARTRLSRVRLVGNNGAVIPTGYTADLDAGTVTIVDATGYSQPVTLQHRIEDLVRVSDVQIDGTMTFTRQLSHDFPMGSIVSSALMTGTLRSRVSHLFDQYTWDGITYRDTVDGDVATGTYNDALAPIEVTNAGALPERWALRFTSTTAFECFGENVGRIGTGTINADFSPINAISGTPYFTLRALGWGGGWAIGNVLRINTVGAMHPFAAIRTVQQGPAAGIDYTFELLGRGDVDRPAP